MQLLVLQCSASKDNGITSKAAVVQRDWPFRALPLRAVISDQVPLIWFSCRLSKSSAKYFPTGYTSAAVEIYFSEDFAASFIRGYDTAFCILSLLYTN